MRDNWCIGFNDRFTVAVWVGNLEGDPMRAVSGTSGAAPVWHDVMLALHAARPGTRPAPPAGIEARAVAFAGPNEPARREWFVAGPGQGSLAAAPAHRQPALRRRLRARPGHSGKEPEDPAESGRRGVGGTVEPRRARRRRGRGGADGAPRAGAAHSGAGRYRRQGARQERLHAALNGRLPIRRWGGGMAHRWSWRFGPLAVPAPAFSPRALAAKSPPGSTTATFCIIP
jgi:membrane peptidoglycan carboxypeptidase